MTDSFESSIFSNRRGRRVLICVKGNCAPPEAGFQLEVELNALLEKHGLNDPDIPEPVTCRTVQCLGVCHSGPIMMVHPEAIRYCQLDQQKLEQIVQGHFIGGKPIGKFQLPQRK